MKADHRHELKTNELADWLVHFPDWLKENRTTLIAATAIVAAAIIAYFWIFYQNNIASTRSRVRLTNLVTQLPGQKANLAQALAQQKDQSYLLIDLAKDLQDFAGTTSNDNMAALALIERADALRAELYYRPGDVSREEMTKQIASAQTSYQQAFEKASGTPALAATARFGLGLCEEELGNWDKAKELYREIADDSAYEGTAAQAAAAFRLKTMDDYKGTVVFKPAPQPQTSAPMLQIKPGDANTPIVIPVPNEVTVTPAPVGGATEPNASLGPVAPPNAPDANSPAGG